MTLDYRELRKEFKKREKIEKKIACGYTSYKDKLKELEKSSQSSTKAVSAELPLFENISFSQ